MQTHMYALKTFSFVWRPSSLTVGVGWKPRAEGLSSAPRQREGVTVLLRSTRRLRLKVLGAVFAGKSLLLQEKRARQR